MKQKRPLNSHARQQLIRAQRMWQDGYLEVAGAYNLIGAIIHDPILWAVSKAVRNLKVGDDLRVMLSHDIDRLFEELLEEDPLLGPR